MRLVLNVLWAVFGGFTLIGIPFAIQHLKLGLVALAPFGKRLRQA